LELAVAFLRNMTAEIPDRRRIKSLCYMKSLEWSESVNT
jgi:hypothetical protein